jgi:hypothetical protein
VPEVGKAEGNGADIIAVVVPKDAAFSGGFGGGGGDAV